MPALDQAFAVSPTPEEGVVELHPVVLPAAEIAYLVRAGRILAQGEEAATGTRECPFLAG